MSTPQPAETNSNPSAFRLQHMSPRERAEYAFSQARAILAEPSYDDGQLQRHNEMDHHEPKALPILQLMPELHTAARLALTWFQRLSARRPTNSSDDWRLPSSFMRALNVTLMPGADGSLSEPHILPAPVNTRPLSSSHGYARIKTPMQPSKFESSPPNELLAFGHSMSASKHLKPNGWQPPEHLMNANQLHELLYVINYALDGQIKEIHQELSEIDSQVSL